MFSNEDLRDLVIEKIFELVPGKKIRHGRRLQFRCPVCGDSRKKKGKMRGWFYEDGHYCCFNAGCPAFRSNWSSLKFLAFLEGLDIKELKRKLLDNSKGDVREIIRSLKPSLETIPQKQPQQKTESSVGLKPNWIDFSESKIAEVFVKSRKIDEAPYKPEGWRLMFDTSRRWMVIPWIRDGEMTYYQYRRFKGEPKYMFPKGLPVDVFGIDELDHSFPFFFILEGALDSIWCLNGLATGGLDLSNHQKEIIEGVLTFSKMVYLTDNQWIDQSAMDFCLRKAKEEPRSLFFIWPKDLKAKDPNELYLKEGINPFSDPQFLSSNVFPGLKALTRLSFNR